MFLFGFLRIERRANDFRGRVKHVFLWGEWFGKTSGILQRGEVVVCVRQLTRSNVSWLSGLRRSRGLLYKTAADQLWLPEAMKGLWVCSWYFLTLYGTYVARNFVFVAKMYPRNYELAR